MIWQVETDAQWKARAAGGIRCFALLPALMEDGTVVWFENYWAVLHFFPNDRQKWINSYKQEDMKLQSTSPRPPPTPTKSRKKDTNNGQHVRRKQI